MKDKAQCYPTFQCDVYMYSVLKKLHREAM